MSKKEQKPKRWDLARDGTGLLFPRGIKSEPWPEWLSKSFLNIHLLQENPIALRDFMLLARNAGEFWTMIDNLFYTIVLEAEKVLQENPLLKKIDMIEYMSEDDFLDSFDDEALTTKQRNAIAALRSIAVIRAEFFYLHKNGHYHPNEDANPRTAKMLLEMTLLVLAAIRGELWQSVWPLAERGAEQQRRMQQISRIGVEKRKEQGAVQTALWRSIAQECIHLKTKNARAKFVQNRLKKDYPKQHLPSLRTIRSQI